MPTIVNDQPFERRDGLNDLTGFGQSRFSDARIAAAAQFWADVRSGRAPAYLLQEALAPRTPEAMNALNRMYPGIVVRETMTTSDFPYLTGGVLDRLLLASYREYPATWRNYVHVPTPLRDFRTVERNTTDGLDDQWTQQAAGEGLDYGAQTEGQYTYKPYVYSKGARIDFQAIMNDDLGAFTSIPEKLGRGGRRTIAKFVTQLYVDASGPHASFYTGGNANIVTSNPALSIAALQTAMAVLGAQLDVGGEPILMEMVDLVVPPSLEVTANNILNAIEIDIAAASAGGATGQELRTLNWMRNRLRLNVDPYIPIVASSANGNTSWFLFAAANNGRPALEVGFVAGFQEPQLYQKLANTARVGGGIDQMAGDWQTMSQEYKGVWAFGGTRLDPRMTVASNGSGS